MFLGYKDENDFSIAELILDTWKSTKDIIIKQDTDLYNFIENSQITSYGFIL